jgi:hypothetical protein
MLRHAFKEWAVVCRALASGRQSLILRKGGIQDGPNGFRVEHERFWLFPTYVHQQENGIVPEARDLFEQIDQPNAGIIRLQHWVEVREVHQLQDLNQVLKLAGQHIWSEETVRQRFEYRQPGLFVLLARVYAVPHALEIPLTPYYEGCRSWVELERPLAISDAVPVLNDVAFAADAEALVRSLSSTDA